ncbi:hypothetical protein [Clostridium sp. HBUAS56017]|uniref:hypothetical protein n=1 Tax=Clostridium sp. HBUAS56017 TaxID=2571128 RepID=UPI001A9ACB6F|nr:hypothetical protein [Clostridium sp. HBUAS56017]
MRYFYFGKVEEFKDVSMPLDEKIEYLENKLQDENFETEELRNQCLELIEWLEELKESRKVIRVIQEQLLNSDICVLSQWKIGIDTD